jgi:hypothetical protein
MAGIPTEHAPTEDRSRRVVELVRQGIMMTGGKPEEVSQFALDEAFAIAQEKESKIRALNYERDSKKRN